MGVFNKSLSREIGKNTGKWVSNKMFGATGHATPHRITRSKGGGGGKGIFSQMQTEREEERIKREQKIQQKREKEMKLEELSGFFIGNEKEEISENLNFLVSTAHSKKDKKVRKVCIEKIEFGIMKLKSNDGHAEAEFFTKKLEELNKKKGLLGFFK